VCVCVYIMCIKMYNILFSLEKHNYIYFNDSAAYSNYSANPKFSSRNNEFNTTRYIVYNMNFILMLTRIVLGYKYKIIILAL